MNILIISKDYSLFSTIGPEDTRKRHIMYAQELQRRFGPRSEIRIICYTAKPFNFEIQRPSSGLVLYPTNSFVRLLFLVDVVNIILNNFRNWRPDIITGQTPWEDGLLCLVLSRIYKTRFIIQLHFDLFSKFWLNENPMNRLKSLITIFLIKRSDGVRVVNSILKSNLIINHRIPESKIFTAPVGVSYKPIKRIRRTKINEYRKTVTPTVLYVGRFYRPKNLPLWIQVAERLCNIQPDFKFIMIGNGPLFKMIQKMIRDIDLVDNFSLLGEIAYDQLASFYKRADVLLLTSNHESYGRVIIEAYLEKLPVVSTRTIGALELIEHGIDGIIADNNDVNGLADAVMYLMDNERVRRKYGLIGYEKLKLTSQLQYQARNLVESFGSIYNG